MSDLTAGLYAITGALPEYKLARKFFTGEAKELFANPRIAAQLRSSADRYRVNLAKRPVLAIHDRLEIASVSVSVDGEESNEALTELFMDKVYRANEQDIEIPDALLKALTYGDAYLVVWPTPGQDLDEASPVADSVDVFLHAPEGMRAIYSEESPRSIRYVVHTWRTDDDRQRVNLHYADRTERYVSVRKIEENHGEPDYRDNQFKPYTEDEAGDEQGTVANPWGQIPVFHLRTARPYGTPEHIDAYGPQNILTKLVATQLSAVDYYGWPFRYALSKSGTTGADLSDWGDDERTPPARGDNNIGQPGTLAKLHDTDAVGQLEASPASNFTEPIAQHVSLMALATGTPMDLGSVNQRPSGESQREGKEPLVKRAETRQASFGATLQAAYKFAMRILGFPDVVVTVNWQSAQRVDSTEGWQTIEIKQRAGVPRRQTLIEAGYAPEQVDEWEEPEPAAAEPGREFEAAEEPPSPNGDASARATA